MVHSDVVIITAYAKPPANTTADVVFKSMVVAVVVDMKTSEILEADASLITDVGKRFISSMLTGYPMDQGPAELLECFDKSYYGNSKRALEMAFKHVFAKYDEIKSNYQLYQNT